MRLIIILLILLLTFCTESEDVAQYPDCITYTGDIVSQGCGTMAYQYLDSNKVLKASISLDVTKQCQTFDLSENAEVVEITLEVKGPSPDSVYFNYCSDAIYQNQTNPLSYPANVGIVTISSSVDYPTNGPDDYFDVTIHVEGLMIPYGTDGDTLSGDFMFWDVRLGGQLLGKQVL